MATTRRMTDSARRIIVGVDTHRDINVAAVLDDRGGLLGRESFPTTAEGHRRLADWASSFGSIDCVGVEGTGSYGAGLARSLARAGHRVVEVDRPNRQTRRRRGKSDAIDAEAAARAVLAGTATGVPKQRDSSVEAIRALRVARRSAMKARTQAGNQMRCLISSAPDELRDSLRGSPLRALVDTCSRFRGADDTAVDATKAALRSIARRHRDLSTEIEDLDALLAPLITAVCPELVEMYGVGIDVAGQLLVTVGENRDRLRSDSAFAHLCGVAPIPVSSGRTDRFRLNRGGDRHANSALYTIVLCRLRHDPRTQAYAERRSAEGRTKPEIIRCLKRYVAREVFQVLRPVA